MSSGKIITATATGRLSPLQTSSSGTGRSRRRSSDANFSEIKLEIPAQRTGNSITPVSGQMKQELYIEQNGESVLSATKIGGGNWTFVKDQNNNFVLNDLIRRDLTNSSSQLSKNISNSTTQTAKNASFVDGSNTFKLSDTQVSQSIKGTPTIGTEDDNALESNQSTEELQKQILELTRPKTKLYNDGKPLVYPINDGNRSDYIQIQLMEYKKSGFGGEDGKFSIARIDDADRFNDVKGTVFLPIQSGIVDNCSVDWGQGQMNPITAQFANAAYGTIAAGAGGIGAAAQQFGTSMFQIADTFKNSTPELRQLLVNYFTEQAVGTPGLLSRSLGGAINNNLELLFNGPTLRSFTFTFRLTPRKSDESKVIREIIRLFKTEMHPALSESELFLLAPNVFKIKYKQNLGDRQNPDKYKQSKDDHPYLNKIKICALKDFSVNYTPDGSYMTYNEDGSMTSYELNMTFAEINPIYKQDYEKDEEGNEGPYGMGW